jgi:excinuclease ABC subunit C
MKNDRTVSDLSEDGGDLYPHMKLTSETFPRALATRVIAEDDAEYFGAFLGKTSVRILIDFLNRTFRLRSCDIPIDGSFPVPCTQYYLKRCVAPCVANICLQPAYIEMVGLVRLFLADRRRELTNMLLAKIEASSEDLDFETAVRWRDILLAVEEFWTNSRLNIWLDDTVDTYDADETVAGNFIYLVSQRGSTILGRKVFKLPPGGGLAPHEALERIISSFYKYHLPKEIRVSLDFEGRKALKAEFTERFGRPAVIALTVPSRQRITSIRALRSAWAENELEFVKDPATARQISGELRRLFELATLPTRVEAFDVAHISGTSFAAASSVWENGEFVPEEYEFHLSPGSSEITAMAFAVRERLSQTHRPLPDLILIDGGKAQLNAALKAIEDIKDRPRLAGAVKPVGQHLSISRFVADDGTEIVYESGNPAQNMLRLLRDAAHDLANQVHRDLRDLGHHYELAAMLPSLTETERRALVAKAGSMKKISETTEHDLVRLTGSETAARAATDIERHRAGSSAEPVPLIVPIRFQAENGDADDLRPIAWR